jgi:hypothetical protein
LRQIVFVAQRIIVLCFLFLAHSELSLAAASVEPDHASLVFALCVRNHHVGAARRCAKRQIAIFIERVVRIVIGQRIGIAENGGGFMKGDAMLGEIADSPPRVPLEFRYLSLD